MTQVFTVYNSDGVTTLSILLTKRGKLIFLFQMYIHNTNNLLVEALKSNQPLSTRYILTSPSKREQNHGRKKIVCRARHRCFADGFFCTVLQRLQVAKKSSCNIRLDTNKISEFY